MQNTLERRLATWDHFRKSSKEHNLTAKNYKAHEEMTHDMPESLDKKHMISTPRISDTKTTREVFKMLKSGFKHFKMLQRHKRTIRKNIKKRE